MVLVVGGVQAAQEDRCSKKHTLLALLHRPPCF